ncbi:MAG TPA: PHP domain-containing protein [Spirochaetota bacterium]|nr:PHP domain-containing protein [Spirochaetota bacterium]
MKVIDLHLHSSCSDGIYSVKELAKKAYQEKISVLSLTDHDTVIGISEMKYYANKYSLSFISGIEFSCDFEDGDYHLLGYGIDHENSELIKEINYYSQERRNRIDKIISKLNDNGIKISKDDVIKCGAAESPGKPHIARALIMKGYATNINDAFDHYLGKNGMGNVPKSKISREKAYYLINKSGGTAVLAHPASLNRNVEQLKQIIEDDKKRGLYGIELFSQMHSDLQVEQYRKMADDCGLVVSGGSDFHGDKGETLGCYGNGRKIPFESVKPLLDRFEIFVKKN